ncbi:MULTISPECIES: hypothetical protein [Haloarcula]|uniref:hypothetical protein n=1 Tax=Haloarcula TaxID=2237 RepID=UPI0023EAD5EE|nr:hypothetical protein [Halomicroarcula sp. XH51]
MNTPSKPSSPERPNELSTITTTEDRQPHLWRDSHQDFDGFARLLNALAEKTETTDEAINICLLAECIADHFARGCTTVENTTTTIDLAQGHSEINQLLSPTTLERAEALDVIEPPTVYNGSDKIPRRKIARRTLWDLGPTAKEYLDMQAVRGFDEKSTSLRSDANEGIAHRYIVRLTEHAYTGAGKRVKTYIRAADVADVSPELDDKVYDIVAYGDDGTVAATCEVEMRPNNRSHITDDARLHAILPGDSDWVVYRKQDVNRLLSTFVRDGSIELPDGHPGWDAPDLSTTNAMERLERVFDAPSGSVPSLQSPIITSVTTADNIRAMAQTRRPDVFQELTLK